MPQRPQPARYRSSCLRDFVKEGVVTSLAHPGGNITGQTAAVANTEPLELVIEAMPGLKRLGVVIEAYPEVESQPQIVAEKKAFDALARTHGVAVHEYRLRSLDDVPSTIKKVARDRIQAVSPSSKGLRPRKFRW
jgi:ABC-type uncharacterized transport system substrate-binding protein